MFSKELEALIQATLADGVLEDNEKLALVKRAQKEGVDLGELEIYINSILQKRKQEQRKQFDKETAIHEKERLGNICPHCGAQIPPMTKICPSCGQTVNINETGADKELNDLIEQINRATVQVKSASDSSGFKSAKAQCEGLLKKATLFYGDNKKVKMLVFDLQQEIENAEKKHKNSQIIEILCKARTWAIVGSLLLILGLLYINENEILGSFGILIIMGSLIYGILKRIFKKR